MKTPAVKQELLYNPVMAQFDVLSGSILSFTEESVADYCSLNVSSEAKFDEEGDDMTWSSPLSAERRSSTGSDGSLGGFRTNLSDGSVGGITPDCTAMSVRRGSESSYDSAAGYGSTPRRGSGSSCGSRSGSGSGSGLGCGSAPGYGFGPAFGSKCGSKVGHISGRSVVAQSGGTQSGPNRVRHKAGHTSYADLITRAILSLPEMRMTLSQIYDWMADHVTGLKDQRSLHSSKGWKNAVRHTLSINPRFKRIERQGRPGLWMVESLSVSSRYHTISHSSCGSSPGSRGGSPATPSTVDAPFLVQSGARCLESDRFRLTFGTGSGSDDAGPISPNRNDCKPTQSYRSGQQGVRGNRQDCCCSVVDFNSTRQTIAVFHEDGTKGYLTLPNPIHLAPRSKQEAGTQTEAEIQNVSEQRDSFSIVTYAKPIVFETDQSPYWNSCSKPRNQFLSLPDDLQDISLDPTLDYGNIWRDEYWF